MDVGVFSFSAERSEIVVDDNGCAVGLVGGIMVKNCEVEIGI